MTMFLMEILNFRMLKMYRGYLVEPVCEDLLQPENDVIDLTNYKLEREYFQTKSEIIQK